MRALRSLITSIAAIAAAGGGCALDAGAPLVTVADGALDLHLDIPSARALGPRTILTSRGERVEVTALTARVEAVVIAALGDGASGDAFDPASPPPGYSLCHSGHCHADDGDLVPYADIQRELAGGTRGFVTRVRLPVEAELDLLAPSPHVLDRVEPSRDLDGGSLDRVSLQLSRVHLAARVEGARTITVDATLAVPLSLERELQFSVDRDAPPEIAPRATLALSGLIFDAIDLVALTATTTDTLRVEGPDDPGGEALLTALATHRPTLALEIP